MDLGLPWRMSKGLKNTLELIEGFWFKANEGKNQMESK